MRQWPLLQPQGFGAPFPGTGGRFVLLQAGCIPFLHRLRNDFLQNRSVPVAQRLGGFGFVFRHRRLPLYMDSDWPKLNGSTVRSLSWQYIATAPPTTYDCEEWGFSTTKFLEDPLEEKERAESPQRKTDVPEPFLPRQRGDGSQRYCNLEDCDPLGEDLV